MAGVFNPVTLPAFVEFVLAAVMINELPLDAPAAREIELNDELPLARLVTFTVTVWAVPAATEGDASMLKILLSALAGSANAANASDSSETTMVRQLIISCFPPEAVEPYRTAPAPVGTHCGRRPERGGPSVMRDYACIETQLQCGIFDKSARRNSNVIARRDAQAKQGQLSRRPVAFTGSAKCSATIRGVAGRLSPVAVRGNPGIRRQPSVPSQKGGSGPAPPPVFGRGFPAVTAMGRASYVPGARVGPYGVGERRTSAALSDGCPRTGASTR